MSSDAVLSTERQTSAIRSGNDDNWVYPSEEQFARALARKGKAVPPAAVPDMLAIHNALNDAVWTRIVAAEHLLRTPAREPALVDFCGMPDTLSLTAAWHVLVRGGKAPFDRHDWRVAGADGRVRRYVIDYYGTAEGEGVFSVHIRPAVDSLGAAYDRMRLWLNRRLRGVDPFA